VTRAIAALRDATHDAEDRDGRSARLDGSRLAVHVDGRQRDATPDADVLVALTEDELSRP
jgi:hypothetical protein